MKYFRFLLFSVLLTSTTVWAQSPEISLAFEKINTRKAELADSNRLIIYYDMLWEMGLREYPEWSTELGFPMGISEWTDNSFKAIERRKKDIQLIADAFAQLDRTTLPQNAVLNYDLLKKELDTRIEEQKYPEELLPINQLDGIHQGMPYTISIMPRKNVGDYHNILRRLERIAKRVDEDIALMKEGLKRGITNPKVTMRNVPEQIRNIIPQDPMASSFLEPFTSFPQGMEKTDQVSLTSRAIEIYTKSVKPAFERLHEFTVKTYLPGCRETINWTALPEGKAWYEFAVRKYTTLPLTPLEIVQVGNSEVARIRKQMDSIKSSLGFKGDLEEFLTYMRTDPKFFFKDSASLIEGYQIISKRADAQMPKLFGKLPRLPYGVVPVPTYSQKSQTTAYYNRGSQVAGRPGLFYANTYDLPSRPKWEMEPLTLHEAVPGHHLQIALSQEIEGIPELRKEMDFTAFIEGWGLYAEKLGEEMDFYKTPYDKMGQLTYEMWRAIRLVVDVSMHTLGWSRENAIQYFEENAGKASHDIEVEVDRYIVWPGQALAYKIGELQIRELRAFAEEQLGGRFNIRQFHDELLSQGTLPMDILRQRMMDWVMKRR
jgi:uncharacterized protein (DUF885 family)